MIFAKYIGLEKGLGFIKGKVYFGMPEMDSDVASMEFVTIKDENGNSVRVIPKDGRFEFFDQVYAVILERMGGYGVGEVVILNGGEINGDTYVSIKDSGFWKASGVEVLDETNVGRGMVIQDVLTGIWGTINKIDDCMWIACGSMEEVRPPTVYKFAVSYDGQLMSIPLVKCIDINGLQNLTIGKIYQIERVDGYGNFVVENDCGDVESYLPSRFLMG